MAVTTTALVDEDGNYLSPLQDGGTVNALLGVRGGDGSGFIVTGGTAQELFKGLIPGNGFEVVNPDASEDLWISDSVTAVANGVGCIRVAANGGSYYTPTGMRPFHAVSIVAATTAHKFTARSW